MAAFIRSRLVLTVLAASIPFLGLPTAAAGDDPGETLKPVWSDPAPLASKSLLLDAVTAGERIIAVGDRGHVIVSEDAGARWTQILVPTRSMLTAAASPDGRHVWAVGHDQAILHSGDGGVSWTLQRFAPEEGVPLLDVWFQDPQHGLAVGAYGLLLRTGDGGRKWSSDLFDEEERHGNALVQSPDGTLFIAAEFGLVFRSRDAGETWEPLETPYRGSFFNALALADGTLLVYGLRGNVFRSTDGGDSWTRIPTGTTASLLGGSLFPDGTLLIVGLSGAVLASRDAGLTLEILNRPDRVALATVIPSGPGYALLVGENGVHREPFPLNPANQKKAGASSDTR